MAGHATSAPGLGSPAHFCTERDGAHPAAHHNGTHWASGSVFGSSAGSCPLLLTPKPCGRALCRARRSPSFVRTCQFPSPPPPLPPARTCTHHRSPHEGYPLPNLHQAWHSPWPRPQPRTTCDASNPHPPSRGAADHLCTGAAPATASVGSSVAGTPAIGINYQRIIRSVDSNRVITKPVRDSYSRYVIREPKRPLVHRVSVMMSTAPHHSAANH